MRQPSSNIRLHAILVLAVAAALGADQVTALSLEVAASDAGRMSGTVASVDVAVGEVGLVTGVGHALRLVDLDVGSDCRILVAGMEAALSEVKRGAVVAVRYRITASRYEALVIETLAVGSRSGGER